MIYFTVMGKPQGKARPRFDSRRKITYTPEKTKSYETLVRTSYRTQCRNELPLSGAVKAEIIAYFPIPKSAKKAECEAMEAGAKKPTVKPDMDNIIKAILDALNGYAYKDDAAVVKVIAEKRYAAVPRVTVKLTDGGTL
ncbi:MAG: RusA family crossover junction endodeoxyribonuclease [Eubacterium sp.]|nr:RusA family crossover junction endodeoxyribonuclease [Eubacterium sp.]